ncbi:hypothetical protein WR25_21435 [Diploscapter pachys]|uniref:Uncharacterized protein n=1 Tax=Diploscapter pachys TaxID=2018661 RepID=A0A2A2K5G8_9BILA|nr:hypothetical protein WR25_21435 [Diploscapter pachys]
MHSRSIFRTDELDRRRARTVGPYGRDTGAAPATSTYTPNYSTQYSRPTPSTYTGNQSAVPWRSSFKPSSAYSAAPYSSHAFRSKTPVASYGNGTMRSDTPAIRPGLGRRGSTPAGSPGAVIRTADAWPPAPNSSGAEMSKDDWLRTMINQSDEDDLVTTMCRRKDIHRHIYIYAAK